jgi:hypothetical protein
MDGDTLKCITKLPILRTDYNAEEVSALRQKYEAAKKAANEAESDLYPFGVNDH